MHTVSTTLVSGEPIDLIFAQWLAGDDGAGFGVGGPLVLAVCEVTLGQFNALLLGSLSVARTERLGGNM